MQEATKKLRTSCCSRRGVELGAMQLPPKEKEFGEIKKEEKELLCFAVTLGSWVSTGRDPSTGFSGIY